MRSTFCFILLLIALPLSANAQDQHKYEIAGGYSHMYILGDGKPGWFVSLTFKKDRWLAVGADISGHSLEAPPDGSPGESGRKVRLKSFHIGPRVFISTRRRIIPFIHGLLGVSGVPVKEEDRAHLGNSHVLFSGAIGAGVDYRASDRVAVRLVQFDLIGVNNEMPKRKRFSTAIVFRF